jgi:hypothetical protein
MKSVLPFAATAMLVLVPSPGEACPFAAAMSPLLFERLPTIPAGAVAARVEILARSPNEQGIRARIVEMIRGEYGGVTLQLHPAGFNSCVRYPQPGETGIVVGRVVSSSPEALIIDPELAPSAVQRGEVKIEVIPTPH